MPDGMRQAAERALQRCEAIPQPVEKGDARRNKYGNHPTTVDGMRFDSKSEARYYERLQLERKLGVVQWFITQVPFRLEGGVRFVVDFLVAYSDGRIELQDVKSKATITQVYRNKKKQLRERYGLEVIEV